MRTHPHPTPTAPALPLRLRLALRVRQGCARILRAGDGRAHDERGVASVWTLLVAGGIFIGLLGLVYDGGEVVNQRSEAHQVAEQAARGGADELADLRSGDDVVSGQAAQARATQLMHQAGWDGTVTVNGNTVTVNITGKYHTVFLMAVGFKTLPIGQTGQATAVFQPRPGTP